MLREHTWGSGSVRLPIGGADHADPQPSKPPRAPAWRWTLLALRLLCVLAATPQVVRAGDLLPQLSSGGHSSKINDLKIAANGRFVASVAQDKVVYIWDLEQPERPVRVLRGESGNGVFGFLHAVAISPPGNLVAVGGWTRPPVNGACDPCDLRLYDTETRQLKGVLAGHRAPVQALAFSSDGRRLLSGDDGGYAILWDVEKQQPLTIFDGLPGPVQDVAFHPNGQSVVIATKDGTVQIRRPDTATPTRSIQAHTFDERLWRIAVSSRGVIATASDARSIKLWDGNSGQLLRSLDHGSAVASVAFDTTGTRLVSGAAGHPYHTVVWDAETGRRLTTYRGHDNTIQAIAIVPNEAVAVSAGGNRHEIHVWQMATGKLALPILRGAGATATAVAFSDTGDRIAWGYTGLCPEQWACPNTEVALEFQMKLPKAGSREGWTPFPEPFKAGAKVTRTITAAGNRSLRHAFSAQPASKNEVIYDVLNLERPRRLLGPRTLRTLQRSVYTGQEHLAYSFTRDGKRIVSGGRLGVLEALDPETGAGEAFEGHTSDVNAIAVSPDGRLLASASTDQTIRLWNIRTRELVVSLFHSPDNGEWVMWTPQGYFTSSKGGESLIGWQINEGFDKSARFVTAQQVRERFRRPHVIERAIRLGSARQALAEAGLSAFTVDELKRQFLPRFTIDAPQPGSVHAQAGTPVTVSVEPTIDTGTEFAVFVNERLVDTKKGFLPVRAPGGTYQQSFDVILEPGPNRIVVRATNEVGFLDQELRVSADRAISTPARRRLFLVSVGVNLYPKLPGKDLQFATEDACDFHDLMLTTQGRYYTHIQSRFLLNGRGADLEPTAANVRKALGLFKEATEQFDTAMLFVSGHGINDKGEHYFLTSDAAPRPGSSALQPATMVSWRELRSAIKQARGRRVVFVDTCHADGAYNRDLEADSYKERILAFSATDGNTLAQELVNSDLKNGVFTHAVINGLRGKGGIAHGSVIKATQLHAHVNDEVVRLTRNGQVPSISGIFGDPEVSMVLPPLVALPNYACRARQSRRP